MLVIPGQAAKDVCDRHVGISRRQLLSVGGSTMLGMTLGQMLQAKAAKSESALAGGGARWNKAKSIILLYLQGGPSHLDLWDPKDGVPDNVRSVFKRINSKVSGMDLTENMPKFAQVTDKGGPVSWNNKVKAVAAPVEEMPSFDMANYGWQSVKFYNFHSNQFNLQFLYTYVIHMSGILYFCLLSDKRYVELMKLICRTKDMSDK